MTKFHILPCMVRLLLYCVSSQERPGRQRAYPTIKTAKHIQLWDNLQRLYFLNVWELPTHHTHVWQQTFSSGICWCYGRSQGDTKYKMRKISIICPIWRMTVMSVCVMFHSESNLGDVLFVVPLDYMLNVNDTYSVRVLCVTDQVTRYFSQNLSA